jgi:hypothetical protein
MFCLMFLTHLQNGRTLPCFVAPSTTPPAATPNPPSTFEARIHIPGESMWQQQGKKWMVVTSLFAVLGKLTCFSFVVAGWP